MWKHFNTTGLCFPEEHYMVNIDGRLEEDGGPRRIFFCQQGASIWQNNNSEPAGGEAVRRIHCFFDQL